MELEVTHHSGIPETGVLSIRAGGTRRQAQLATLDRPFKFPNRPEECSTFKVDVLNLLGSARLAYNPAEVEYSLALDPAEEAAGEAETPSGMEVVFQVRRCDGEKAVEGGEDALAPALDASQDQDKDQRREQEARQYLEKHGLTTFMQFLMQSLMKDKPANPYSFLQKQVTKRMVSEVSRSIAGDRIDLLLEDKGLDTLLQKFSSSTAPVEVTAEQLAQLERDAAVASEQLRADNARLRETAAKLKDKYGQLLEETAILQKQAMPESPLDATAMPASQQGESPQIVAYREIAAMQDEIKALAQENSALVSQLAGMRTTIDSVYTEIDEMQANLSPSG